VTDLELWYKGQRLKCLPPAQHLQEYREFLITKVQALSLTTGQNLCISHTANLEMPRFLYI